MKHLTNTIRAGLTHRREGEPYLSETPTAAALTALSELERMAGSQEPVAVRWCREGYHWTYEDYKLGTFYGRGVKAERLCTAAPPAQQPVGRVDGDGQVTWFAPIPEDGANLYAGHVSPQAGVYEAALRKVLNAVQAYLPPDGIDVQAAMGRIIEAVDPWPDVNNPTAAPVAQQPQAEQRTNDFGRPIIYDTDAVDEITCALTGDEGEDDSVTVLRNLVGYLNAVHPGKTMLQVLIETEDARAQQPQAEAVPPECDVRKIMLDVVPGVDGEGHEVYAKSVADIVNLLTEMGQRIEDLEGAKQAEAVPSDVVRDADVEAAAKKMAEILDYPWDFMPEKGRNTMRENVREVLAAAQGEKP